MTDEPEQPTQHDDWVSERDRGLKLHNMLQHPGWVEVLAPALARQREGLLNKYLTDEHLKEGKDFVLVRQSILAVDSLLDCIKAILAVGEKAAEMLKKETEEIS